MPEQTRETSPRPAENPPVQTPPENAENQQRNEIERTRRQTNNGLDELRYEFENNPLTQEEFDRLNPTIRIDVQTYPNLASPLESVNGKLLAILRATTEEERRIAREEIDHIIESVDSVFSEEEVRHFHAELQKMMESFDAQREEVEPPKKGLLDKSTGWLESKQPLIEKLGTKLADLRISLAKATAGMMEFLKNVPGLSGFLTGLLAFVGANTSLFYQELMNHKHLKLKATLTSAEIGGLIGNLETEFRSQLTANPNDDFRSFVARALNRLGAVEKTVAIPEMVTAAKQEAEHSRANPTTPTPAPSPAPAPAPSPTPTPPATPAPTTTPPPATT